MELLEIKNLSAYYKTDDDSYNQAVDNVSFTLNKGEVLGLIGESGCGKSTLGYSIINMMTPPGEIVGGEVFLEGRDVLKMTTDELLDVLWSEIAMIPQNAMNALNPSYKIGSQIVETIRQHQPEMTKTQAETLAKKLIKLVGIDEKWYDSYPHKLSGGMKQRIIIAMAISCNPKIIICDEATTGLDVLIQAQILALLKKLQTEQGMSIIIISHDLMMVASVCEKIGIMYAGNMVEMGTTEEILENPLHPYTKALFASQINADNFKQKVEPIKGVVPKLINPKDECRYLSRCDFCFDKCHEAVPQMKKITDTHYVACYLYEEDCVGR